MDWGLVKNYSLITAYLFLQFISLNYQSRSKRLYNLIYPHWPSLLSQSVKWIKGIDYWYSITALGNSRHSAVILERFIISEFLWKNEYFTFVQKKNYVFILFSLNPCVLNIIQDLEKYTRPPPVIPKSYEKEEKIDFVFVVEIFIVNPK